MKIKLLATCALLACSYAQAQGPQVTSWMINTTGIMGQHYVAGNSTPIQDAVLANVQTVQYSDDWVYATTHGIPAYITGPFQDGNPYLASDQNAIYRISRSPQQNTGNATATTPGNIGVFVNGVSLFDWRDGVAWNPNTNALCGGPGNPMCPGGMGTTQAWNRDAIPAERAGFDCAKAHPAMGNYHHHQNPSAFDLDQIVISTVCDLYPADGLYAIDANEHSPLIGFAYDGFPIYGAIGFANADGTGGVTRMISGWQQRNITTRTTHADGTTVATGPPVSTTYPIGYFREDNEFIDHTEPFYLDEHNGRFAVTPEYPDGTYAYYCTVDENWNSAYPYVIGPTFYGVVTGGDVNSITETVTTYDPSTGVQDMFVSSEEVTIYPNPASDLIAIQMKGAVRENLNVQLLDLSGKVIRNGQITQGSTIWHMDIRTLYDGDYIVRIGSGEDAITKQVQVLR